METSLVGLAKRARTTRAIARAWQRAGYLGAPPYHRVDEVILRAGAAAHTTPLTLASERHQLMVRLIRGMCAEPHLPLESGLVITGNQVHAVDAIVEVPARSLAAPMLAALWLPIGQWWRASSLASASTSAVEDDPFR